MIIKLPSGSWNLNQSGMTHGPHGSCQGFLVSPLLRKLALGSNDGRSSLCLGPPCSVKSGLPELESIVFFCEWGRFCSFSMGEVGGSFESYIFFLINYILPVWMAFFRVRCFFLLLLLFPLSSLFMGGVYRWWLRLDVCIICLDRICLDWLEVG